MKKIIPLFMLFILLLTLIPSISANPALIVQSYNLHPEVLLPGDSAVLTITIQNADVSATETTVEGTSNLDMITTVRTLGVSIEEVRIIPAGVGSKKIQATTSFNDIGVVGPGSVIPVSFDLTSDSDMTPGLYFPKIRIDPEGYDPILFPIPVRVTDEDVQLTTTEVPSKLSVSGSSDITLSVINHLAGSIDDVQISPGSSTNLQITPQNMYLGTLAPSMSQPIHFSVNPQEIGDASVLFNLTYHNGYNQHVSQLLLSFSVIDVLDVAPVISRFPSRISQGMIERVSLEVYNAKNEEITGVIVTPITDVPISPAQYFIGSMDPDDVFSASFDVDTSSLEQTDYAIAFKVTFKQDSEYYETPVVSSSFTVTAQQRDSQQPSLLLPIGIIIIVFLIVLVYYMRRKKRR